jgi:hypothetical protein
MLPEIYAVFYLNDGPIHFYNITAKIIKLIYVFKSVFLSNNIRYHKLFPIKGHYFVLKLDMW